MKIPRTINQQYEIVRAADEEQRTRKTSVKREATVSPTVCRRIMLTPDVAIHTITIPCGDTAFPHTPLPESNSTPSATTPLPESNSTPSATTPHARPFESQPNDPW